MRIKMKGKILLPIIILILATASHINAIENISPKSLQINVYPDGSSLVEYIVESDPAEVRTVIELIGDNIENLVIKDEENYPLEYRTNNTEITVDSIGASEIVFTYYSYDFTSKDGPIWDLNVSSPITTGIYLPEGATLFDLSDIPLDLNLINNQQYVLLPAGEIHVSYIISIPDLNEEARNTIDTIEEYLSSLEDEEYILLDARQELENAEILYRSNQFIEAKDSALSAQEIANETILNAESASREISFAQSAINQADIQGKTTGLESANEAFSLATDYYEEGLYNEAEIYAKQANQYVLSSTVDESSGNTILILGGLLILVSIVVGYFILSKKDKTSDPSNEETVNIDVRKIFDKHETLRIEDREVIKFLAENGGEIFATEIRERFDLPRSTAWRLIRRLKELEIIEEVKIGNQSLLRIKEEFHV
jgi:uncharacterized membrane protein